MSETPDIPAAARDVLDFWFGEVDPEQWFERDDAFDELIRARFAQTVGAARDGTLDDWAGTPHGCLALILLIDQFSRNLHRASPLAWSADDRARALTKRALNASYDDALAHDERTFLYMPLMHSEDPADQELSVELYRALAAEGAERGESTLDYAVRHRDIVARFGRFPHRNAVVGRASTPEEIEFLEEPGSAF